MKGAGVLSDTELLQAMIGSGGKGNDCRQIAENLNAVIKKIHIENLTIDNVKSVKGIGDAKATVVFAALEFWRRKFATQPQSQITSVEEAVKHLAFIKNEKKKHFLVITLDGARRLIKTHKIPIGARLSHVHPREVFALAIEDRAASIIAAHNNTNGSLKISGEDRETIKLIRKAGELLGITLDDHIIIAGDRFDSIMYPRGNE
jgi:DNA repair protein RadC